MRWTSVTAVLLSLAVGCTCEKEPKAADSPAESAETKHGLTKAQADEVLVKIGDTTITVGQFAERLAEQSPYLRARYNSPERRREFLDNLIRFELLAIEAQRRGYTDRPEVQRSRKQVMIQQLMKEEFEDKIKLSDITDEEVSAYYQANVSEFQQPEQVRASHILIKSRAVAQRTLQQILQRADDVNLFRETASRLNEDAETKERFGDLRFFSHPSANAADDATPTTAPAAVAEAAFGLTDVGDVHRELVASDAGFHIVKLTGRRAALSRTLEESSAPIRNRLWREKREKAVSDFLDSLRARAQVEEHWDLLPEVHIQEADPADQEPAAAPRLPGLGGH